MLGIGPAGRGQNWSKEDKTFFRMFLKHTGQNYSHVMGQLLSQEQIITF
jgi:hypothetical protein